MALSYLLLNVSKKTVVNELESLFPMLLHSLQSSNPNLKRATLETFMFMLEEASQLVSTHFTTVIHCLIKLFSTSGDTELIENNGAYMRFKKK